MELNKTVLLLIMLSGSGLLNYQTGFALAKLDDDIKYHLKYDYYFDLKHLMRFILIILKSERLFLTSIFFFQIIKFIEQV